MTSNTTDLKAIRSHIETKRRIAIATPAGPHLANINTQYFLTRSTPEERAIIERCHEMRDAFTLIDPNTPREVEVFVSHYLDTLREWFNIDSQTFEIDFHEVVNALPREMQVDYVVGNTAFLRQSGDSDMYRPTHFGLLHFEDPDSTLIAYAALANPIAFGYFTQRHPDYQPDRELLEAVIDAHSAAILNLNPSLLDHALVERACARCGAVIGALIRRIPELITERAILKAIEQNPLALGNLPRRHHSYPLCYEAVRRNPDAIAAVKLPLSKRFLLSNQAQGLMDWAQLLLLAERADPHVTHQIRGWLGPKFRKLMDKPGISSDAHQLAHELIQQLERLSDGRKGEPETGCHQGQLRSLLADLLDNRSNSSSPGQARQHEMGLVGAS